MSHHAHLPRRALAFGLAVLAAAGACAGPSQSAAPSGAGGSGAACAAAPSVDGQPEGWGPPATAPELTPFIISSAGQLVCGPNRVLFTVLDKEGRPAGAPELPVEVAFFNLGRDAETPIANAEGAFMWAIEGERGIYATNVAFPESGVYGAAFKVAGGDPIRLTFDVQPSSAVLKVGDRAPASKTPTLASVGGEIARISTDTEPEPAFYETSVDQALADNKPFVVIFATPKFCKTAQCGPTLERIKPFVDRYPTVTFINVEPYKLKFEDGSLQADLDAQGQLQTTPATDPRGSEWRLFSEPTVYVVDRNGVVTANFELIFSDEELTAALDAVK